MISPILGTVQPSQESSQQAFQAPLKIVEFLKQNPSTQELCLSSQTIDWGDGFDGNTTYPLMRSLKIEPSCSSLTSEHLDSLLTIFPELTDLYLDTDVLSTEFARIVMDTLGDLKKLRMVTLIGILHPYVLMCWDLNPSVREIFIQNLNHSFNKIISFAFFQRSSSLETIFFEGCQGIDDKFIEKIAQTQGAHLRKLLLTGCTTTTPQAYEILKEKCLQLNEIELKGSPGFPLMRCPIDVLGLILQRLDPVALTALACTSKELKRRANDPALWRPFFEKWGAIEGVSPQDYKKHSCHTVWLNRLLAREKGTLTATRLMECFNKYPLSHAIHFPRECLLDMGEGALPREFPYVQSLKIRAEDKETGQHRADDFVCRFPRLVQLHLNGQFTWEYERFPYLKKLTLKGKVDLDFYSQMLRESFPSKIKIVSWAKWSPIPGASLDRFFARFSGVRSIELSGFYEDLEDPLIISLATQNRAHLQTLRLERCSRISESAKARLQELCLALRDVQLFPSMH